MVTTIHRVFLVFQLFGLHIWFLTLFAIYRMWCWILFEWYPYIFRLPFDILAGDQRIYDRRSTALTPRVIHHWFDYAHHWLVPIKKMAAIYTALPDTAIEESLFCLTKLWNQIKLYLDPLLNLQIISNIPYPQKTISLRCWTNICI